VVLRLAGAEFLRLATRVRLWVFLELICIYGVVASRIEVPAVARGAGIAPARGLYLAVSLETLWLFVIGISLVAGGTFAEDRRSGYLVMQLSRGVSVPQIVVSRLCAVCSAAALSAAATTAVLGLSSVLSAPRDQDGLGAAVSFVPELLELSPFVWALLVAGVNSVAAAAMLSASLLIGALTTGKYVSEIGPPLGTLLLGFAMTGPLWAINPLERASFMQVSDAEWAMPGSMILYWGCVLAFAGCAAVLVSERRRGA
jgi:hypothetical protein